MENTLDSIRPSENPEEMSYLFGRDPSILAYSQRPFPSKDTKKNLISLYETEEESNSISENTSEYSDSQILQTIKVFLRLKPIPKKLKLTEEQQEAYKIVNSNTLITKLPSLDSNTSCVKQSKNNETVCKKFTFSQTFGPEATQLQLFEQTVQQQMINFVAGHNCNIMTYGTTNSGKSYTLQGTTTSPGLIPRALEFVFNNITTRPNPPYKPLHCCDVVCLDALERAQELEAKTKLLTFSSVEKHQYMNAYKQMQKLLQEESVRPSECHDAHYSVWISFAEIYNEIVYDLLSSECQKKRTPLKLGADSNGRAFIKGLKTVYVNSAAEAYQILMAGQYNLKIAATALNAKSSRSHCIFTIVLLKYYVEDLPDKVEVSMFSFCDLAGSERLKKTLNIGDRLKEAQNINTSLLVLGRCLKSIHEGQLIRTKTDAIGPFRESKLTRLFQRALSGKEHLALIVNVNPLPNLYVETQNVLNFAAIAKKIIIEKKRQIQNKLKSRFSQIITQNIQKVIDWDSAVENEDWQNTHNAEEAISGSAISDEYLDLVNENEKLKKEIAALKNSTLIRDFQSRQEMADKYIAMINALEVDWKQRINDVETEHEDAMEWAVKQVEEFYKGKLNQLHRKKRSHSVYNEDNLNLTNEELDKENVQLREKNENLNKMLTELKITNETLIVEKNKACFELALSKEDLKVAKSLLEAAQKDICFNSEGEAYIEKMSSQLLVKDEQVKKLKEFLNEAKEEYITITRDIKRKELCIDEQAKIMIENEDKIEDLETHLEQVNICLTEKTGVIEHLEEKLESQFEKLSDAKDKISQLQREINQLKMENLELHKSCLNQSESSIQDEYQEIIIKEELVINDTSNLNITKNIQEENNATVSVCKTEKTDLNDSNSIEEKPSENNINVPQTLLSNIVVSSKPIQTFVETGCQTDITNGYNNKSNIEDKVEKDTQTMEDNESTTMEDIKTNCNIACFLKEEAVQTVEIMDDNIKLQLKELNIKYNDVQTQYEQECLKVEKLTDALCDMKNTMQTLEEEDCKNKALLDEYIHSKETLEKQLSLIKLNSVLKCEPEEEVNKSVSMEKNNDLEKENLKQLDKHKEEVLQLEKSFETIVKLKDDIIQLNKNLEMCQTEKDHTQKVLNENNNRLLELENRLKNTTRKEQEKDTEIVTLQKELKHMIQRNENTEMTEVELKSTINELSQLKETLLVKEQCVKELNIRLENSERNAKLFNLLEENSKERQLENERLRIINDELKINLVQKDCEMDSFMKNRDEMVIKYETLVKNQQEELERQKREVMRYQELFRRQLTPTPKDDYKKLENRIEILQNRLKKYETPTTMKAKDDEDTTSEDEVSVQRQPKRRGRKIVKQEDIPVIELSGSESKRSTRRAALRPPKTSTEKTRSRKKKLFQENESFTEIEPSPVITSTRSLRNRKK